LPFEAIEFLNDLYSGNQGFALRIAIARCEGCAIPIEPGVKLGS
jgi:hypothetical protein